MKVATTTPYFLTHPWSAFQGGFSGVIYNRLFEPTYHAITENMKYRFGPKCQNFSYKGSTKVFLEVAVD